MFGRQFARLKCYAYGDQKVARTHAVAKLFLFFQNDVYLSTVDKIVCGVYLQV
jgi:hypothetical protein